MLFLFLATITFAQTDPPLADFDLARIERASVLIMQTTTVDGVAQITFVSSRNNRHARWIDPDQCAWHDTEHKLFRRLDLISLSVREGEPPVPSFRAFVTQPIPGWISRCCGSTPR